MYIHIIPNQAASRRRIKNTFKCFISFCLNTKVCMIKVPWKMSININFYYYKKLSSVIQSREYSWSFYVTLTCCSFIIFSSLQFILFLFVLGIYNNFKLHTERLQCMSYDEFNIICLMRSDQIEDKQKEFKLCHFLLLHIVYP